MSTDFDNYNFLSPTGFRLVINRERFQNLEFYATAVTLPSLSHGTVDAHNQQYKGYVQGDVTFEELTIRVAVDEDMRSYKELFQWIIDNRNGNHPLMFDGTLVIMTSHNNPNKSIMLKNMFPTSVSSIEFDAQASDIEYMLLDVSFRYDEFEFVN